MQIIKFGLIGLLGTLAHYLVLITGVDLFNVSVLIASSIGFVLGAFINHHFNRKFTFSANQSYTKTLTNFMWSAAFLFIINLLMMQILVVQFSIQYIWSQIFTTGVVFLTGFIINKYLVFSN